MSCRKTALSCRKVCPGPRDGDDFRITSPRRREVLCDLTKIRGRGRPFAQVCASIDCGPPLCARVSRTGRFAIEVPIKLGEGPHTLVATQTNGECRRACVGFRICKGCALPKPEILHPENGALLCKPPKEICGRGVPGSTVRICINPVLGTTARVDETGCFCAPVPVLLTCGAYTLTAVQIGPREGQSGQSVSRFTIG